MGALRLRRARAGGDVVKPSLTPTNTATPTPTNTHADQHADQHRYPHQHRHADGHFHPDRNADPDCRPIHPSRPTRRCLPARPSRTSRACPPGVGETDRWILVDLTDQRTYAYEGTQLVNSFLVSTGTWRTPTVTGTFKIYVKYRYADMRGPGYHLRDVPYVMYFYKGYGLHGTYWHNNFGTPMSHGCVNLQTDEAGWLFNWASVGTVVHVQN
jgi:lipoprotein-anchoring transpeptidase ErfK/SrfK